MPTTASKTPVGEPRDEALQSQKAVLITGCSSGIGLAAAQALQARGYQVVASCRRAEDVEKLRAEGFAHCVQLDLACPQSIATAVEQALELSEGRLFAVFNNGAYGQPGAVEDLSREALRKQFETNVFGTHELTCLLLPHFLSLNDARIIQNSSILGLVAMPFRGAYNASKFALEGLTDTLRLELRGTSTKVSLIEPGPIVSRFRQNALQALEQNLDMSRSRHGAAYEQALARLRKPGKAAPFTLPADAVVAKLIHALESPKPKPRYYVTFPTHLMGTLKRVMSTRALDYWVNRLGKP